MQTSDLPVTYRESSIILRMLGDPTRLHIMLLLSRKELCVCEIVKILSTSQSNVSQHLAKLRSIGLVRERRDAQWTYYNINWDRTPLIKKILDIIPVDEKEIELLGRIDIRGQCKV